MPQQAPEAAVTAAMADAAHSLAQAEEDLVERGFAVLADAVPPAALAALRAEWAALEGGVEGPAGPDDLPSLVARFGCVLEPVTGVSPLERRTTRTPGEYQALRARRARHGDSRLSEAVGNWLFGDPTLAKLLAQIFGDSFYLYNEQYICKPPGAGAASAFAWHRDSDRAGTTDAFVSCWCPLTDVNLDNGGLIFRPYGEPAQEMAITASAGSMVLLAHDVEHCSSPNLSMMARNAYMVQFSQLPMTTGEDRGDLIAYAVSTRVPI